MIQWHPKRPPQEALKCKNIQQLKILLKLIRHTGVVVVGGGANAFKYMKTVILEIRKILALICGSRLYGETEVWDIRYRSFSMF